MHLKPGIERGRAILVLCLLLVGLYQLSGAALIKAKAWLAPVLVERAWQQTLATGVAGVKPWPWADTWPVARLRVPARGVDQLVLAGDSGNALAFGPGHALASAPLGSGGLAVIGGHRDTHFAFLRLLKPGELLHLELPDGSLSLYQTDAARIVDIREEALRRDTSADSLLLVTCFPFDTLTTGGPQRYTLLARRRAP